MKKISDQLASVAIIPARGGSKGIRLKNLRWLCGKPLIAHTILAAREANLVQRVVVSTDHDQIANTAKKYGAEVVIRPEEISGDTASSESALIHTLNYLKNTEQYTPDLCIFLQCTSPLTTSVDIDNCIRTLIENNADTSHTVTPFHYFLWSVNRDGNSIGVNHNKTKRLLRQERENQFLETGAIYVMKAKPFMHYKHRFFGRTAMHVVPAERCFEIDEPIDLNVVDILMRKEEKLNLLKKIPNPVDAVVFDFDGVFTNNMVNVNQYGDESVTCSRGDGMGLSELKRFEIPLIVLSSEKNPVVLARCQKLNIEVKYGLNDKAETLREWIFKEGFRSENVIYIGNDINDVECLKSVGCSVVVSDAHDDVKPFANIILAAPGGHGAIRELADLILRKMKGNENDKLS